MKPKPIPTQVINLLKGEVWLSDDYDLTKFKVTLEYHSDHDNRDGCTAQYWVPDTGSRDTPPIRKLLESGVVHPDFYQLLEGRAGVNQHYLHSLEQFFGQCQRAWDEHQDRTYALINTPAGTIRKRYD
jgi:hypothetical protein